MASPLDNTPQTPSACKYMCRTVQEYKYRTIPDFPGSSCKGTPRHWGGGDPAGNAGRVEKNSSPKSQNRVSDLTVPSSCEPRPSVSETIVPTGL